MSRTNDEEMSLSTPLSIGILGTSNIARKNILAIATSKNATCLMVGSRDENRAREYAEETNVPDHGSYEQVLAHPNVDSVYIPLPTTTHLEWVLKAAKSGKHVLCEKPVAVNTSELIEMLRACRDANVARELGKPARPDLWRLHGRVHSAALRRSTTTDSAELQVFTALAPASTVSASAFMSSIEPWGGWSKAGI